MVKINSGGMAPKFVIDSLESPEEPDGAKTGKPGEISEKARSRSHEYSRTKIDIDSHPIAGGLADAAESGAPFVPVPGRRGLGAGA